MQSINWTEAIGMTSKLVLGASRSVSLVGDLGFPSTHGLSLLATEGILAAADNCLRLRALIGLQTKRVRSVPEKAAYYSSISTDLECLDASGWQIRAVEKRKREHYLIVDNEVGIITRYEDRSDNRSIFVVQEANDIQRLRRKFRRLWTHANPLRVLYHDAVAYHNRPEPDRLLVVSASEWDHLIRALAAHPERLYSLEPRRFEELVAELLVRRGLRVTLTPPSRDRGRDILAFMDSPVGRHLYLVECKRYAAHRPVDVSVVRALYGVVEAERATAGLLVTTSRFTSDARSFRDAMAHRISLKDYEELKDWLKES